MSCCGNKRTQFLQNQQGSPLNHPEMRPGNYPAVPEQPNSKRYSSIFFEYTGKTGMTVWGSASGKRYRFDRPGSLVIIDPRDRPSMALVPNLKQVLK